MVESLLSFKAGLDDVMTNAFSCNELFSQALKDAFEYAINTRQNKPAELIAKFIDGKLRSGNKGLSDEQLEAALDQALSLFRFISVCELQAAAFCPGGVVTGALVLMFVQWAACTVGCYKVVCCGHCVVWCCTILVTSDVRLLHVLLATCCMRSKVWLPVLPTPLEINSTVHL